MTRTERLLTELGGHLTGAAILARLTQARSAFQEVGFVKVGFLVPGRPSTALRSDQLIDQTNRLRLHLSVVPAWYRAIPPNLGGVHETRDGSEALQCAPGLDARGDDLGRGE
jgi:hypothetical protein